MERQKYRLEMELAAQLNKRTDEKEVLQQEKKKEREDLAAVVWVEIFSFCASQQVYCPLKLSVLLVFHLVSIVDLRVQ